MFADLLNTTIQPENINVECIPEIEISTELCEKLEQVFTDEENKKYVNVSKYTTIVQSDKNYVFFSNHWYYLAVVCKKYAEALYPYCVFFDEHIKNDSSLRSSIAAGNTDISRFTELFSDEDDKDKMLKFIKGDSEFRPGKNLLNGEKSRSTKDIFGSCILKKISVPDASSGYLGNVVYYLAKRPDLFNLLEDAVNVQIKNESDRIKLSSTFKECAKEIIDYIYDIDRFERIKSLFINNKNIKINTEKVLTAGNLLRYVFIRPDSDMYTPGDTSKARVFTDKEYDIEIDGKKIGCRLTTEWTNAEAQDGGGNYLSALIAVVNKFYSDLLEVKDEPDFKWLYTYQKNFKIDNLPDVLKNDFSRRYITSLLAKPFVILTGNSGTGKTRIAKQFAEYFERIRKNERNWLIVPVGADWTDNTKILGFYNPFANDGKGEYIKTNVLELIERAHSNREIPYFLILDEMNLSHVERYFSDFLSHMETPDSIFEIDGYDKRQPFPENLFVIGTVNIDETTYMFSPKVLDRANVVEFKPDKKAVMDLFINPVSTEKVQPAGDRSDEAFLRLAKEIRSGKNNIEVPDMERIKKVFDDIYEELEKCGFEFAYRTVKEIRQYISAAYEIETKFNEEKLIKAIDEQLLQKVLPKIHGNKKEIGGLLDSLIEICKEKRLTESMKKIEQMKGKLAATQYASFI